MMSPAFSSNASDSLEICSATLQIMFCRFEFCLMMSFTASEIAPLVKCPVFATGWIGPSTAERSKLLPISHGFFSSPIARCFHRDVGAARLQRRHQFDLIMIVLGEQGIRMIRNSADGDVLDRVGGLLEEERRLPHRIRAHLTRMRGIVAPDAIDASDRKYVGLADDGDRGGADRENGFRAGLRLGRNAMCRGASQRQRAGCEDGPAIDGIHGRSPVLPVSVIYFAGGF